MMINIDYSTESGMYDEDNLFWIDEEGGEDETEEMINFFTEVICFADELIEMEFNDRTQKTTWDENEFYDMITDWIKKNPNQDLDINIYGVVYS